MSDTNTSDEGCRRCGRLEDQLETAEKQVRTVRAQLRESGEYRDGLAAKILELETTLDALRTAVTSIVKMNGLTLIDSPHEPEEVQRAYSRGAANAFAQAAGIAKVALSSPEGGR